MKPISAPILTYVTVNLQVPGVHAWRDCPIPEVEFLRHYHRHLFHVTARKAVTHDDRDIEIIMLKGMIENYLRTKYCRPGVSPALVLDFGGSSCEMIARDLLDTFALDTCEVLEDGENGGLVVRSQLQSVQTTEDAVDHDMIPPDPSGHVRSLWTGIEVELTPHTGEPCVFITDVSRLEEAIETGYPVYLCPQVAAALETIQLEHAVVAIKQRKRPCVVACFPADLRKLTSYVKAAAHVMLDLHVPEIAEAGLTWQDMTVKVIAADYTTLSASSHTTITTSPADYRDDNAIS